MAIVPKTATVYKGDGKELKPAVPAPFGDVAGASSSTDNAIVRFDGITGKVIQDSPITITDTGELESAGNIGLNPTGDLNAVAGGSFVASANVDVLFSSGGNIGFESGGSISIFSTAETTIHSTDNLKLLADSGIIEAQSDIQIIDDTTGAGIGTLTNAPHIGNPNKYLVFRDSNGDRYGLPAWLLP